jgi:hypothetical protein
LERTFTFRFYDISRDDEKIPSMVDMLRQIAGEHDKVKREKQLATDYVVRLENFEDDGANAVVGELIRCQDTNLPAEISKGARKTLTAERLGHSIVFRLNHKTGAFGIQYDSRVVSPGRILDYVASFNPKAIYSMAPRINAEAWKKFVAGDTRKLAIRIANPENMELLSGTGAAASQGIRAMGEAYGAPSISVEISMGHHKGFLKSAEGLAKKLLDGFGAGARLDKLMAVTVSGDESEVIDLIEDRLVSRDELEIHPRDPETNWTIKRDHLIREMKRLVG